MRLDRKLLVVELFTIAGLVFSLIVGLGLKREYDNEVAAASKRTQNLTRTLEVYTRESMRRVEFYLSQATSQINAANNAGATAQRGLRQSLTALLPADGLVRSFAVIDTKGAVIASTAEFFPAPHSIGERDYFVSQLQQPSPKPFIGAAIAGRGPGQWIVPVSVALMDSDGKFHGVLVGTLEPEYFQRFFDTIDTGSNGFVTLFTRQGMIAARSPFIESLLQRSWIDSPMFREHLPAAQVKTVRQVVVADGVERVYSYRALDDYPLVVSMGVSLTDSLSPWRAHAKSLGALLVFLLAGFGFTAYILVRQQQAARDSKLQLQAMLSGIPIPVFIKDAQSRFLEMNGACEKQWGMRLEDLQGTDGSQYFPPDQMNGFLADDKAVFEGGRAINFEEWVWSNDLQKDILLHTFKNPVYDRDGKPLYLICAAIDVTQRKNSQDSLEKSLKEKEALLKEVHHRVKNNLQVITSLLRLESGRSTAGNIKVVLGDMQARIRAMALLHESLYRRGTFASVDLGEYLRQLSTQAFQMQTANSGTVRLEHHLAVVEVGIDQAIPCGLLVSELISNCLKHGFPAGSRGKVSIDLQAVDNTGEWCLRVSDTGVGLPVDFEDKRKNSLGLNLAVDLARQIGGELKIRPNSDTGVVFTVTFRALEPAPLVMPD